MLSRYEYETREVEDSPQDGPCWIGIDGSREGWCACIIGANGDAELVFLPHIELIWYHRKPENIRAIAIDMPLALASKAERGGRNCEREGRKILAAARKKAIAYSKEQDDPAYREGPFVGATSIFTPPSRPALEKFALGGTHAEVSEANRQSANDTFNTVSSNTDQNRGKKRQKVAHKQEPGLGLSIQSFNIMPKILEVDDFIERGIQKNLLQFIPPTKGEKSNGKTFLFECHPELAFLSYLAKHKEEELENQRGFKSKKLKVGRIERIDVLKNSAPFKNHESKKRAFRGLLCAVNVDDVLYSLSHKVTHHVFVRKKVTNATPTDDVIDSMICATTAKRFDTGKVIEIGGSSTGGQRELDFRGVPMSIFV
ncbi:uncharacterized protein FA14DRAFT_190803 [Meira miltonrushii]|uniref:DUF429 domain-containing protein n=1 Tax=Meira miltonrushii TaxID=1280837 RepID=A0A316VDY9_9BASI|nr:uncharacterized protein FA14DRAFT_190803 [Meira miltonrushii]PWN33675.1 hypothetical protein FA14DRAFT_190803 [Meira miltonrushii]